MNSSNFVKLREKKVKKLHRHTYKVCKNILNSITSTQTMYCDITNVPLSLPMLLKNSFARLDF